MRPALAVNVLMTPRSIKRRRKRAAWDPQYLLDTLGPLQPNRVNLDSLPCVTLSYLSGLVAWYWLRPQTAFAAPKPVKV